MIDPKASSIRMKAALSITAMVLAAVAAVFYFNGSWGQAPAVVAADIPVLASGQAMAPAALPWPDAPAAIRLQADDDLGSVVVRAAPNLPSIDAAKALAGQLAGIRVKRVWVQCKQDESDENEGGMIYYPGKLAPVAPGFEDGRLGVFINALVARGVEVAAWVPAFHDPTAWNAHPDWHAMLATEDGEREAQSGWLCPRQAVAVAYEAGILAEVAEVFRGKLAAVFTDFIRFDDDYACACDHCLAGVAKRAKRNTVTAGQLRRAAAEDEPLWRHWIAFRSDAISDALDTMRDYLEQVSPDIWFGASVLPFSAKDYALNTQSGQDLAKMCKAGVDEIVLMGYWDDWAKSPEWLRDSLVHARQQVGKHARLTCLLDGDMSLRATARTLAAIKETGCPVGWFNYGAWLPADGVKLLRARRLAASAAGIPAPGFTAVCIRIDTEPDYRGSYEAVNPAMIGSMVDMFREESVPATFVTCAKLAEAQAPVLRAAAAAGHEIAVHAYDHEQLDAMEDDQQIAIVDKSTGIMRALGFTPLGFGAPRNSITDGARNRLMELGYYYDGSAAFDPMITDMEPSVVTHPDDHRRGIVVVPFVIPNDWDARFVDGMNAGEMTARWLERLAILRQRGAPCCVIDVHQWSASRPEDLAALRAFIRSAKAMPGCKFTTLGEAARHAVQLIHDTEAQVKVP